MSNSANRLIKNTGWLYIKIAVNMFITLFTTRIILKGLGTTDYGIFNIVGGSITMLGFLNSTMANVTQRFINYSEGQGDKIKVCQIFNVAIIIHFFIAIIVGLVLICVGYFFFNGVLNIPNSRMNAAMIIYGSLILSTMFSVMTSPYEAIINAHENMKYFAIISIFENVLKLSVAYICAWVTFDKLITYGSLMATIPFITLTIMRIYCHRHYDECKFSPKRYFSKGIVHEMLGFAGWNFWTATSSLIAAQGMGVVLNSFYGVLLNAAQGIANQVGSALMVFSSNALKALNPILTKTEGAGDRNKLYYVTLLGCRIPSMILGILAIPTLYLIPELLDLWLEDVPNWAITFTRLMIIRNLVELPFRSLGTAIYAQGNIKHYSIINSLFNIAPLIIVYFVFLWEAPPSSLYIVWIVFCILGGMNLLFFCHKLTNLSISLFFRQIIIPYCCISILSVSIYAIPSCLEIVNGITCKLVLSIISGLSYLLMSYRFMLSQDERNAIIGFISNKI